MLFVIGNLGLHASILVVKYYMLILCVCVWCVCVCSLSNYRDYRKNQDFVNLCIKIHLICLQFELLCLGFKRTNRKLKSFRFQLRRYVYSLVKRTGNQRDVKYHGLEF